MFSISVLAELQFNVIMDPLPHLDLFSADVAARLLPILMTLSKRLGILNCTFTQASFVGKFPPITWRARLHISQQWTPSVFPPPTVQYEGATHRLPARP